MKLALKTALWWPSVLYIYTYIYIYIYKYIYIYVQCIFFLFDLRMNPIKSQFSTSSKVVDANQQRLSATWLQLSQFFAGRFPPFETREVFFAPEGLGADPRGSTPMSRFFQEFVDPKKDKLLKKRKKFNHSIKFTIKLRMQRFIEAVSFASYLCICPFSSGSPPMCGAFDGFGSIPAEKGIWACCGKSVEFLVRIWDTPTPNKTILQPLVVKPLTSYKACQELIHSSSVNPAVSC